MNHATDTTLEQALAAIARLKEKVQRDERRIADQAARISLLTAIDEAKTAHLDRLIAQNRRLQDTVHRAVDVARSGRTS